MSTTVSLRNDRSWQVLAVLTLVFVLAFGGVFARQVATAQPAEAAVSISNDSRSLTYMGIYSYRDGKATRYNIHPGSVATSYTRSGRWGYVKQFCVPYGYKGTVTSGTARTYGAGCHIAPTTATWRIRIHR